jgi:hypothetical protein
MLGITKYNRSVVRRHPLSGESGERRPGSKGGAFGLQVYFVIPDSLQEGGVCLWTLSQIAIVAVDSLSRSCSGVNLSTSHQGKPGGHGTPRRS